METYKLKKVYANWTNELHNLNEISYIDMEAPNVPKTQQKIEGIKLLPYEQQQVVAQAYLDAELKGYVESYLPPIDSLLGNGEMLKAVNEVGENITEKDVEKIGKIYSDIYGIALPVGSGKTLIIFMIIALRRIPLAYGKDQDGNKVIVQKNNVILGTNPANSTLAYANDKYPSKSKQDDAARSVNFPCYITEDVARFPSYIPKVTQRKAVSKILGTNILFCVPHIYEQMIGYCKTQINFPWRGIKDTSDLLVYIMEFIKNPIEVGNKYWLLVVADIPLDINIINQYNTELDKLISPPKSDEELVEEALKAQKEQKVVRDRRGKIISRPAPPQKKQETFYDNTEIVMRINKYKQTSNGDNINIFEIFRILQFIDGHTDPYIWARVFLDDYDSLKDDHTWRVWALNYCFISSSRDSSYAPSYGAYKKFCYADPYRIPLSIKVNPNQIENIIGKTEIKKQIKECEEDGIKNVAVFAIEQLLNLAIINSNIVNKINTECKNISYVPPSTLKLDVENYIKLINGDSKEDILKEYPKIIKVFGDNTIYIQPLDEATKQDYNIYKNFIKAFMCYYIEINCILISYDALLDALENDGINSKYNDLMNEWYNYLKYYPHGKTYSLENVTTTQNPGLYNQIRELNSIDDDIDFIFKIFALHPFYIVPILPFILKYLALYEKLVLIKDKNFATKIGYVIDNYRNFVIECKKSKIVAKCSESNQQISNTFIIANIGGGIYTNYGTASKSFCISKKSSIPTVYCKFEYPAISHILRKEDIMFYSLDFISEYTIEALSEKYNVMRENSLRKAKAAENNQQLQELLPLPNNIGVSFATFGEIEPFLSNNPIAITKDKTTIRANKLKAIREIIVHARKTPASKQKIVIQPIYLLFVASDIDLEAFTQFMKKDDIKVSIFNQALGAEYKARKYQIIICQNKQEITGFNMEYIDGIIFYNPIQDIDVLTQIIGRGKRIGRAKGHELYIYTLAYPQELTLANSIVYPF